jgi:hypothetical protein
MGGVSWPVLRLPSGVSGAFGWAFPHAAFSPGGDYLYYLDSSLGSFVLRRFPMRADELIELAVSLLSRGLTDDECSRYAPGDTCRTLQVMLGERAGS